MELASDTKILTAYSPTSTPLLDVLRPVSRDARSKLSAGEYFLLSGAFMLSLVTLGVPSLRRLVLPGSASNLALTMVLLPALAVAAAAAIHELGHLLAARIAGFRLLRLATAPGNHGANALHPCKNEVLSVGSMIFIPRGPGLLNDLDRRLFTAFLGGPTLSLLWPVLLEVCPYWPTTQPWTQWFVHLWAAASALIGIAALLPDTSRRGVFSDGARLLMLLKKDALAARCIALTRMQQALSEGLHPREWKTEWIIQATAANDDTRDSVTAQWLAFCWAAERGDITLATRYLEEALAAPPAVASRLRDRLFLEAAVFQAWFRENPGKARIWSDGIRFRKLSMAEEERLKIALLWAEGCLFDAWEKLAAHLALLQQMPASGVRELAEKSALEWKRQMESRMLTRAWRTMYNVTQQVEGASAVAYSG